MLRILYLVHDLTDPSVRRRVLMLQAGGAHVRLAGFRRRSIPLQGMHEIADGPLIDLGMTHDGRLAQRAKAVVKAVLSSHTRLGALERPDVIIARNLEMLAIAERVRRTFGNEAVPVVYECLDIHRLVLRRDAIGWALRGIERQLTRNVRLLLTSSPAFLRNYFIPFGQIASPVELVENKHFEPEDVRHRPVRASCPDPQSPFRIGWFGALRCRRSLEMLARFSRRANGRYEVVLRGHPSLAAIPDFHQIVDREPYMRFEGSYRNPEDLPDIYGSVHFTWAIDFYEAGQNSEWLLPNRLYEGCSFGAVPIAKEASETGRFLKARGIGLLLSDPSVDTLGSALDGMDAARFAAMSDSVGTIDRKVWRYDRADCVRLVQRLGRLVSAPGRQAAPVLS